jgi:hypothetical protein
MTIQNSRLGGEKPIKVVQSPDSSGEESSPRKPQLPVSANSNCWKRLKRSSSNSSMASEVDKDKNIYLYNPWSITIRAINWFQIVRVYYLVHIYVVLIAALVWNAFAWNSWSMFDFFTSDVPGYLVHVSALLGHKVSVFVLVLLAFFYRYGPSYRS